jgi:histidyl-tRNA synthetase
MPNTKTTKKTTAKPELSKLEIFNTFAKKTAEIASYYGFDMLSEATEEEKAEALSNIKPSKKVVAPKPKHSEADTLQGISPIMHEYIDQNMLTRPQPVKLYCSGTITAEEGHTKPLPSPNNEFALEVLGSTKSISDAMVIFIAIISLRESGFSNLLLDINSLGDSESRKEYQKQLTLYYKKISSHLCSECKHNLKSKPLALLECQKPVCITHKEKAPQTIAHLSVESKQHFKEVLEFLDALNITYRINTNLVRGLDFYSHTVFEITELPINEEVKADTIIFGAGGRYDGLAKKLGSKKDIPAVGCTLHLDKITKSDHYKPSVSRAQKKAKIYFIQIGFEAKLKSMDVLETLRTARISVMHALAKDSLMQQLATAEKSGVKHAIIFGQKEAIDGTVIVRNLDTRGQEIVKIKDLAEYIKKVL